MFCPYCGASLVGDEIFCSNCGSKLPELSTNTKNKLSHAQQQLPSNKQPQQYHFAQMPPWKTGPDDTTISTSPTTSSSSSPVLSPTITISQKEPWLAALLSFIFPGIGHIYAGKVGRGISIMILLLGLPVFLFFASISLMITMGFSPAFLIIFFMMSAMFYVIGFVLNIYDAYMIATRYNDFVTRHKRPPTSIDKW